MHRLRHVAARPLVVALMATHGRDDRFLERSLGSIVAQRRQPDVLVVVVDRPEQGSPAADPAELARVDACARRIAGDSLRLVILENERTQGAAGAWNTGLDWAHREWSNPDRIFVAVLDDDDAWEPDHLHVCLSEAVGGDRDMVAAGLVRIERDGESGHPHSIPTALDVQTLLASGQHIQGSNLFVRLDRLLEAGLFDEHLRSCTDRDLVVRLALLGGFRFAPVPHHTVLHFADARPDRLSSPGSDAKLDGLTQFFLKWHDTMSDESRRLFVERACRLFDWRLPSSSLSPQSWHAAPPAPTTGARVSLVVGIIVDPAAPSRVEPLLTQLLSLARRPDVVGLDILLLENGAQLADRDALRSVVARWQGIGLRCYLIDREQQERDVRDGRLGGWSTVSGSRLPIAIARSRIGFYAAHHARHRQGSWVWLLDDDARLDGPRADGEAFVSPDLAQLQVLANQGVRVVYGPVVGAPPLPFLACLRTQALDALHALIASNSPTQGNDSAYVANRLGELRGLARDFYYDLSRRDTRLLETPFPMAPAHGNESRGERLARLATELPRALAGEQITRPLVLPSDSDKPDSIRRGPSALWFRPEDLLLAPNSLARIGDTFTRRSDMLVALLSRDVLGLTSVESAALGVRQDRSDVAPEADIDKLRLDILGYAFYSALHDVLRVLTTSKVQAGIGVLDFDDTSLALVMVKFRKYVDERCFALSLSAWRLRGIAASAQTWVDRGSPVLSDVVGRYEQRLAETLTRFAKALTPEDAERMRLACHATTDADIHGSFASLRQQIDHFQDNARRDFDIRAVLQEQRIVIARAAIDRAFGARDLRFLGAGAEGVALTDGALVFKVIDYWKARDSDRAKSILQGLVGRATGSDALPAVEALVELPGSAIVVTPFVETTPYLGRCGPGLVRLLRDCRRLGLVCRNVHPKNLRVRGDDVLLVDYGADLHEFDEREFRSMAKRCWLTWRWSHRPDLDQLMRRSITEDDMPELQGFERFFSTIDVPTVGAVLDPLVAESVGEPSGLRVLDFGCGKGRMAVRLAQSGALVTAYDPDVRHVARWRALEADTPGALHFTTDRREVMAHGPYDVVLASLVLCEIQDETSYGDVLRDLRDAARSSRTVVIAVCNPFATLGGRTSLHSERHLPSGVTYDDVFVLHEHVADGCAHRADVHRPLHRLRRDLLRAGLRIEAVRQSSAVDLDRFEPASDFLVIVACPVTREQVPCTLLIKACPQEWRTIDAQVRHIVDTLLDPASFQEHVLAVDMRAAGFPRPYSEGDVGAFRRAVDGLLSAGYVDRVVEAPDDPMRVRELNRRWFGVDSSATYASNGQATLAFVAALDSCATPLVLQVDSDVMLARADRAHDWLADLEAVFERDARAVTVSLSIAAAEYRAFSAGPWRVETRASVLHRERLLALCPWPNRPEAEALALPWHRSLDRLVAAGEASSYRGADPACYFVHPPNESKHVQGDWMLILDGVERDRIPEAQLGHVDLQGVVPDFLPCGRAERFVFVVTGRNVPPGRMLRCLDSVHAQRRSDWGLVLVDDASSAQSTEFLELWAAEHRDRVTLVRPRVRRGQLANLRDAIRSVCTNPDSIIVTLDLDDELLGPGVLDRVAEAYAHGADVTVGSMLRTDKHRVYEVSFDAPRTSRGANVWQHLRTFRKHLFDAVRNEDLMIDGQFVEFATDWAFMLPVIELARHPVWIREPLYLYEPSGSGKGRERPMREREIGRLCSRPSAASVEQESGCAR